MKYQKLSPEDDGKHGPTLVSIRAPKLNKISKPFHFVIFCVVFVSLYIWVYSSSPLMSWSSEPSLAPNMSWVLRQRESFMSVVQLTNLTAILTPSSGLCDPQRTVTVVVCSAVTNHEARAAIRDTWAKDRRHDSRVFFLVGKSASNDTKIQEKLELEAMQHDDLIQEDFLDSYNNLTLKSVFLLKWAIYSGCAASSSFILKTDDDMYINIPNLVQVLKNLPPKRLLLGSLIRNAVPVRDIKSKWYVPSYVFGERVYPNYLSGTGYVMSTDIVAKLLDAVEHVPFFHLEDIYVTGLLGRKCHLGQKNHEGFKYYKRRNNVCLFRKLITAHMMKPNELRKMYAAVNDHSRKCRLENAFLDTMDWFNCLVNSCEN